MQIIKGESVALNAFQSKSMKAIHLILLIFLMAMDLHVQPLLLASEVVAAASPMLPLAHLLTIIIKYENENHHQTKNIRFY